MKSWTYERFGTPDVLRLVDSPVPTPGPGEVVVRVHAASLNSKDWRMLVADPWMIRPMLGMLRGPGHGFTPGSDVSGVIDAVGPDVEALADGDAVYGYASSGTFAEYARLPVNTVALKPAALSFDEAAAVPLAAITALRAVRDVAKVGAGQRVLVIGASGGVGTFAVQIAKALGAVHVTAVCSARNAALVQAIGADRAVDYATEDVTRLDERFDAVIDIAGGVSLAGLRRVTRRGAIVAMTGGNGGKILGPLGRIARWTLAAPLFGLKARLVSVTITPDDFAAVTDFVDRGLVRPVIDETYPLSSLPDAMRYIGTGHARAKVVITA